jgi:hypothetical protein
MAHAVSRRPVNEARVRARVSPCGIYGRVEMGHGFLRLVRFSPVNIQQLEQPWGHLARRRNSNWYLKNTGSSLQCLATGWTTGRSRFDPRQGQKDFSSSLYVQTGSGAHPASCTMGTGGPVSGAKARPGRDADHSPPSSAEVENE